MIVPVTGTKSRLTEAGMMGCQGLPQPLSAPTSQPLWLWDFCVRLRGNPSHH